MTFPKI